MSLFEQSVGDRSIHTPTYNAVVAFVRKWLNLTFDPSMFVVRSGMVSMNPTTAASKPERVFVAGKLWAKASWTGTLSGYLAVYFDGTTAPAYVSKATFTAALTDGLPDNCELFDLSQTYGDIHVTRAG